MRLNDIKPKPGSMKSGKRVGRGIGSGIGKTCGRGVKGQKSRSGVAISGYEGGQMPIYMRLPKRGFNAPFSKCYNLVNLGRIQAAIDSGKLGPGQPVTEAALKQAGVIKSVKDGVRLLADGELKAGVTFELAGASKSAIAAVEKAGGSVLIVGA